MEFRLAEDPESMQRQTRHFADSSVRDKSLRTGHQWFFCESIQSACFWTSARMGTHVISRLM